MTEQRTTSLICVYRLFCFTLAFFVYLNSVWRLEISLRTLSLLLSFYFYSFYLFSYSYMFDWADIIGFMQSGVRVRRRGNQRRRTTGRVCFQFSISNAIRSEFLFGFLLLFCMSSQHRYYAFVESASAIPPKVRPPPYTHVNVECKDIPGKKAFVSVHNICGDLNKGQIPRNPMRQNVLGEPYPL